MTLAEWWVAFLLTVLRITILWFAWVVVVVPVFHLPVLTLWQVGLLFVGFRVLPHLDVKIPEGKNP